jgi:hypothetical protein
LLLRLLFVVVLLFVLTTTIMAPVNNPYLRKANKPLPSNDNGSQIKSVVGKTVERNNKSNNQSSKTPATTSDAAVAAVSNSTQQQRAPSQESSNTFVKENMKMNKTNSAKQPTAVLLINPNNAAATISNSKLQTLPKKKSAQTKITAVSVVAPATTIKQQQQQQQHRGAGSSSSSFKSQLKQQIQALKRAKMLEKQRKQREKEQKNVIVDKSTESKGASTTTTTTTTTQQQQPTKKSQATTALHPFVPSHPPMSSFYGSSLAAPVLNHHHQDTTSFAMHPIATPSKQLLQLQLGLSTTPALSQVTPSPPVVMPMMPPCSAAHPTIHSSSCKANNDLVSVTVQNKDATVARDNVKPESESSAQNAAVEAKQEESKSTQKNADATISTTATTRNPSMTDGMLADMYRANPSAGAQKQLRPAHHVPATSWYPYPGAMLPFKNGSGVLPPHHVQQPYSGSLPLYSPAYALTHASHMLTRAPPKPAPKTLPKKVPLSTSPTKAPSPFAQTHEVMSEEFAIYKDKGQSFGLDVVQRIESVLVDRDELDEVSLNHQPTTSQQSKRRVRKFFSALMVGKADKQNARPEHVDSNQKLRSGDLILTIDGKSTAGLSFREACALFRNAGGESSSEDKGVVGCRVTIARHKYMPSVPSTSVPASAIQQNRPIIPFVVNEITGQVVTGEFSASETAALAELHLRCMSHPDRALGYLVNPSILLMERNRTPELACRDMEALTRKWNHSTLQIELAMQNRARVFWSQEWANEKEKAGSVELPVGLTFISDAQRSVLRALPRPSTGCKCGSSGHVYVNDPACPLYNNARLLRSGPVVEEEPPKKKPALPKNLNAVETAYAERALKLKEEADRITTEARFVEEMEKLQVSKQKLAVFAPSFTMIVLSAVAEITKNLATEEVGKVISRVSKGTSLLSNGKDTIRLKATAIGSGGTESDENEDDDDEYEITLAALGSKRAAHTIADHHVKRSKIETPTEKPVDSFNPHFLARLLRFISFTWGHLCSEPSHDEHAW